MIKTVNLTLRVPESLHTKMRILAAVKQQNMSALFCEWLEKQTVTMPDFVKQPITVKTVKREAVKTVKRKNANPEADEEQIKTAIIQYQAEGLSLQKIADRLAKEDIPSLRGGQWRKGSVDGLLRKWAKAADS